jgi:hypothetical protein
MPFQYTMANLLAQNRDAVAVIFLDGTGEAVDCTCTDFSPYDMKVVGAYVGIYLRQLAILSAHSDSGELSYLHIEYGNAQLFATPLADGYYLVLVQRRPAMVAWARRTLFAARDEILRETFS